MCREQTGAPTLKAVLYTPVRKVCGGQALLQDSAVMRVFPISQGPLWSPPRRAVARLASYASLKSDYYHPPPPPSTRDRLKQPLQSAIGPNFP